MLRGHVWLRPGSSIAIGRRLRPGVLLPMFRFVAPDGVAVAW
ncbi:MAG: hypothetical protein ACRDMI_14465 [Streptosporangiaceae bacterium]